MAKMPKAKSAQTAIDFYDRITATSDQLDDLVAGLMVTCDALVATERNPNFCREDLNVGITGMRVALATVRAQAQTILDDAGKIYELLVAGGAR